MYVGTITKVVAGKGFAFIKWPGGQDVFMHATALRDGLEYDELLIERRVEFDMASDHRGLRARNVRPAAD